MILCLFKCKHKSISQNSYSRVGTCVCILCWTEQWKCCKKLTTFISLLHYKAKYQPSTVILLTSKEGQVGRSLSLPLLPQHRFQSKWSAHPGEEQDWGRIPACFSPSFCFQSKFWFKQKARLLKLWEPLLTQAETQRAHLAPALSSPKANARPSLEPCALGAPGAMQKRMPGTRSARPSLPRAWSVVPLDFPYKAQVQRKNY